LSWRGSETDKSEEEIWDLPRLYLHRDLFYRCPVR
jgi:hypothetical protein